jgi:hypothetical protein
MKTTVKRVADGTIILCLIAVLAIILMGGYRGELLGFPVSVTSPSGPIRLILILLFLRLTLTLKRSDLLLMLVSVGMTLLVAELGLRIWDAPVTKHQLVQIHRASPASQWELIPGAEGVGNTGAIYRINSAGCRDHEYPLHKSAGGLRAVVLGDSFTFGMGVNLEDTYPKQLERILQATRARVEIINCGVIGHSMWQHRITLEKRAWRYNPDLIILGIYQDDLNASFPPPRTKEPGYRGQNPFEKQGVRYRLHQSYLYNFIRNMEDLLKYRFRSAFGASHVKSIVERKKIVGPDNPEEPYYRIMAGRIDPGKYMSFKAALVDFATAVHSKGVKLLVVLIPDAVQLNDPHMHIVNAVVGEASTAAGVPFLDLTRILERQQDLESLYLFPDDAHNSPRGHGIIALGIAEILNTSGLLPDLGSGP